ncbi:MAG: pyruvate kinase, partial [Zavarzinella sp.]|nr:pyruvate kinase [Zavarzinella sp.]
MPRRTRIVATLGPATDPPDVLRAILEAGVDVARINFSHGTADEHAGRIARLREAATALRRNVAVLADLPGPKLRVRLPGPRELAEGQEIAFSSTASPAEPDDLVITEPEVLREVLPGQRILLDDGRLQLEAVRAATDRLIARVTVGGQLLPKKGLNLPDTPLTIPALTDRDREALATAARAGVDWLALSFVRRPDAAAELRAAASAVGLTVPVLAKIERPEAVDHAAEIIAAFDGIMVARGDLGVEIPLERVPTVQKRLIALARAAGKPVITATDMLDSMRENPRPTRAEITDVANAIYDGTDAVMLSGETAVGHYPVRAVGCMSQIALEAEAHLAEFGPPPAELWLPHPTVDDQMTSLAVELANRVGADAIITPTLSGRTARLLARHRPRAAIVAPAPTEAVLRHMAVVWGL